MRMKTEKRPAPIGYANAGGLRNLPRNLAVDLRRNAGLYLIMLPILLWFLVFCYAPMFGLGMAFERFTPGKGFFASPWVGLQNFRNFFESIYFLRLIRNTLVLGLLDLAIGFPAPILLALMLNELRSKAFKRTVQTISYLPYFISTVILCGLIVLFVQSGGAISNLLVGFTGGKSVNLLGNGDSFRLVFVLSGVWQFVGYGSIIFMAALSAIDHEQYEAAVIDGAGRWKQLLHVTLPGIMPTVIVLLILKMSSLLSVASDKILLLYSPAIYEKADVIGTYVYRVGIINMDYGYSAAVGLFNSVVATILLLSSNAISRRFSESSLF